jgi:hypothetical protein
MLGLIIARTLVSALVQCPGGTQKGHSTWEACVAEWQIHCARGSHSHPRDPLAEHYEDEGRFDKSVIEYDPLFSTVMGLQGLDR